MLGQTTTKKPTTLADAWELGYSAGQNARNDLDLGDSDKKIPIQIVTEDITGSDAYRMAAAEVVQEFFGNRLVVAPKARLKLHIGGTDRTRNGFQHIEIELEVYAYETFSFSRQEHSVLGDFVIADEGKIIADPSDSAYTESVKQLSYKALTEMFQEFEKQSGS